MLRGISLMLVCGYVIASQREAERAPAPFGAVIGVAPGGVECYSCDYASSNTTDYDAYITVPVGGKPQQVYTGMKWQCVELSRRWLILMKGVTYDSVDYAYNIWDLPSFQTLTGQPVKIEKYKDGSNSKPVVGSLIIWTVDIDQTGHVAVITAVGDDHVDIVEDNWSDYYWPAGQNYSRRLPLVRNGGGYSIVDPHLLGWIVVDSSQK